MTDSFVPPACRFVFICVFCDQYKRHKNNSNKTFKICIERFLKKSWFKKNRLQNAINYISQTSQVLPVMIAHTLQSPVMMPASTNVVSRSVFEREKNLSWIKPKLGTQFIRNMIYKNIHTRIRMITKLFRKMLKKLFSPHTAPTPPRRWISTFHSSSTT